MVNSKSKHYIVMRRVIRTMSWPARGAVRFIHRHFPHNKRVGHFLVGTVIVLFGSGLACLEQHLIPKFLWDGIAYLIHGAGSAPIIEEIIAIMKEMGEEDV